MREVLIPPVTGVPRSITVGAAARLVGVHPSTIRRALARGDLEGYRAGRRGRHFIPREALHEWIRPAADPADEETT
jgi:excisionase family DNA binding protein